MTTKFLGCSIAIWIVLIALCCTIPVMAPFAFPILVLGIVAGILIPPIMQSFVEKEEAKRQNCISNTRSRI